MAKKTTRRRSNQSQQNGDVPLRLEYRDANELADNPANWKRHPRTQVKAQEKLIEEVGWAGAALYNETTGRLIDGHMRKMISSGKGKIPVLVGNWTEEQEEKILATLDPIGSMALAEKDRLKELIADIEAPSRQLKMTLDEVAKQYGIGDDDDQKKEVNLEDIEVDTPPKMAWVLIGVPTVRFGEVDAIVRQITAMDDSFIIETTVTE